MTDYSAYHWAKKAEEWAQQAAGVTSVNGKTGTVTLDASDVGAQETLVSGTNIKTINGNSLLGSGNISTSDSTKANTSLDNLDSTGQAVIDGKVNLNASNLSTQGKSLISGLGMPSDSYIDLTYAGGDDTYTAPANGYIAFRKIFNTGNYCVCGVNDSENNVLYRVSSYKPGSDSSAGGGGLFPIQKGQIFCVGSNMNGTTLEYRFIYAEGEI